MIFLDNVRNPSRYAFSPLKRLCRIFKLLTKQTVGKYQDCRNMFGHKICSQCEKRTKLQKQLLQTSLSKRVIKKFTQVMMIMLGEKIDQLDAT